MVIYENMKVIESSIEVYGNMQGIKRPFYSMITCKSYTVPSMAIVWKSMREFYQIMITYSGEQKSELKHSWKTLH